MKKDIKPDNVVYNAEDDTYDAALKAYATSLGAPVITASDSMAWKKKSVIKINNRMQAKYLELKSEYEQMMAEYEYNNLILNSKFSFEPLVGEVYHLYKRQNGETFLSIIAPEECNFNAVGSFYLNTDQIWEKL